MVTERGGRVVFALVALLLVFAAMATAAPKTKPAELSFITKTVEGWAEPMEDGAMVRIGWIGEIQNSSVYEGEVGLKIYLVGPKNRAVAVLETPRQAIDRLEIISLQVLFDVDVADWNKTMEVRVGAAGKVTDPQLRRDQQEHEAKQKLIAQQEEAKKKRIAADNMAKAAKKREREKEKTREELLDAVREGKATIFIPVD